MLAQAFAQMGMNSAFIGTIGLGPIGAIAPASHTTPDPISLQRTLADFVTQQVTQVCMEVSSHALHQSRVAGIEFYCVLYTNLTQDHLDYHLSMDDYGASKARLFKDFRSQLAIINVDDEFGEVLATQANSEFVVTYGHQSEDLSVDEVELTTAGMRLALAGRGVEFDISSPLVGEVNVPNLMLLCATLLALSTPIEQIKSVCSQLQAAPGRMELYQVTDHPSMVVDYAHTPDALAKALQSLRRHCDGQLWCVFGCGGDRDTGKRAKMGELASQYADRIVVTNDNPRSEDPQAIADDILAGVSLPPAQIQVELDRKQAIMSVTEQAQPNDWVLVAGKGHENTQTIGEQKLAFSDRELLSAWAKSRAQSPAQDAES